MKGALGKKVGPLPLVAWLAIAGGSLGVIVLIKKGKSPAKTSGTSETEAEQLKKKELEEVVQGMENGLPPQGSSGGGSGEVSSPTPEVNTPITAPAAAALTPEVQASPGPVETPMPATPAAPKVTAKSKAARNAHPHAPYGVRDMNRETLTGKRGPEYKPGKYKGMAAHIYDAAVHGGVGQGKNIVVLNASKKTHAAQGQHQPAHVKGKTPAQHHVTTRTPRAPATVHHAAAKAKAKAAPKRKIAARAPVSSNARKPKKKVHR